MRGENKISAPPDQAQAIGLLKGQELLQMGYLLPSKSVTGMKLTENRTHRFMT